MGMSKWGTLVCLSFIYFLENFDRYLLGVSRIPFIDYSSTEYSVLAGPAFSIIYAVLGLLITFQCPSNLNLYGNHLSKLTILALASAVFSLSFLLTAYSTTFWQVCIIRMTMGAMQSIITPFASGIITDTFDARSRGFAFGVFNCSTYIAFSAAFSLGTYLYTASGWQTGYLVFGASSIILSLLMPLWQCGPQCRRSGTGSSYSEVGRSEHGAAVNPLVAECEASPEVSHPCKYLPSATSPDESLSDMAHSSESGGSDLASEGVPADQRGAPIVPAPASGLLATVKYILLQCWRRHPYVYTAALATGLRLGAGYVWAAYNGVFFAPLFRSMDAASHCQYSYDDSGLADVAVSGACSTSYPYCVEGRCSALVQNPWHNQGMAPGRLEAFMLWVPLLGSALGNVLGGALSDRIVTSTASAATGDSQLKPEPAAGIRYRPVLSSSTLDLSTAGSSEDSGDIELSAAVDYAGDSSEDGTYSPRRAEPVVTELPSCGDGAGDGAQRAAAVHTSASALRLLVCAVGNLCAVPFVALALIAPYPACFLVQVPAGFLGESYLGQALAVVSDSRLTGVPVELTSAAVALFMLIVICIGGNITLLVPLFMEQVRYDRPVQIHFEAAPVYNASTNLAAGAVVEYSAFMTDARKLQTGILAVFLLGYLGSAALYLLAHLQMKHKQL